MVSAFVCLNSNTFFYLDTCPQMDIFFHKSPILLNSYSSIHLSVCSGKYIYYSRSEVEESIISYSLRHFSARKTANLDWRCYGLALECPSKVLCIWKMIGSWGCYTHQWIYPECHGLINFPPPRPFTIPSLLWSQTTMDWHCEPSCTYWVFCPTKECY